jgi:hypothetical protein
MERAERKVGRLRLEMARRALVGATDGQVSPASGACRPRGEQLLPRPIALARRARASGEGAGEWGRAGFGSRAEKVAAAR